MKDNKAVKMEQNHYGYIYLVYYLISKKEPVWKL